MENQNEKAVHVINDLIECSRDGQEYSRNAAKNAQNPRLKSLYNDLEKQHSQFVNQLEDQLRNLGGQTPQGAPAGRRQTQTWKGVQTALKQGNEKSTLEQFERSESEIESQYDQALAQGALPSNVREIVRSQHETQRNARNQIHSMKENLK